MRRVDTPHGRTRSPAPLAADGGTLIERVDPRDRARLRAELVRFASEDAVTEYGDGTLVLQFPGPTHFTVAPDGSVEAGMALHEFDGPADALQFDHDQGAIRVDGGDGLRYVFRRP
ncbi:MAG: hypothetical protein ABEJ89_03515 [Haloarculaceae archaeon]